METGIRGRVAIIAASSQGIGRSTAERFAAEGARIAMCARNAGTLKSAAEEIAGRYQAEVYHESIDVTQPAAVRKFVEATVARFGGVDICVTNAGGPPAKGFLKTTDEDWQRAVELNLLSAVYLAREVIPHMQKKHWGRVVTITSITARQPVADLVLSNAVRAGVAGLVKSLANEFGKDGILVNNVCPGYTATERLKEVAAVRASSGGTNIEEIMEGWTAEIPLRRLGKPEEIAEAILWLASERGSYVTGQSILVDGGLYKGI